MAVVHDSPKGPGWLTRVLTTDFCPWANRFVYWLKEPVGWFALAALIGVLVGLYISPIGWTIAASLVAIIAVGMVWPWIAVRAAICSLSPEADRVHEDDPCHLVLRVRNRQPLPLWGLAVEGFLDRRQDESDGELESIPTVALAYVRGLSICRYRFAIQPTLRGRYPNAATALTCSFPFGIWTARRVMEDVSPITVWPKIYPIPGYPDEPGSVATAIGDGDGRRGQGDFIGIREYQSGDAMKQVNWVTTARCDRLMVTERGAPESPAWEVVVDGRDGRHRDLIANQVRVAASVLASLHGQSLPIRVRIGQDRFTVRRGHEGFVQMMDALADLPADGIAGSTIGKPDPRYASITISTNSDGNITLCLDNPASNHRLRGFHRNQLIDPQFGLAAALETIWSPEKCHEERCDESVA